MDSAQKIAKLGDAEDMRKKLEEHRVKAADSEKASKTEIAELKTQIVSANNEKQQAINKSKQLDMEIQQIKVNKQSNITIFYNFSLFKPYIDVYRLI